jgi:drug/metabolite transporter (DMT)-like permease
VLLVTNPFDSEWGWGVVVAVAASLCIALKDIATRKLTSIESTSSIMLFSVLLLAAAGLCTAPFGWTWPTNTHMVMFVFIGLTFGLAQLLTIQAYKTAEAAIVASMLLGFAFWGDVPTVYSLLGSAAIVGSSAYILLTSGMPRAQQRSETKIRPQRRTLPP